MKIFLRILSVFSLCILCSADGYGAIQKSIETNVTVNSWTQREHDKQCLAKYNALTNKNDYDNKVITCEGGSIKEGICTKSKGANNTDYTSCAAISCKNGYYLKVREETKTSKFSTNGVCGHDSDCDGHTVGNVICGKDAPCRLVLSKVPHNEWSDSKISKYIKKYQNLYDQDVVKLTNNNTSFKCELTFDICTETQLGDIHARAGKAAIREGGDSANKDDYICEPTECMENYILKNKQCEECPKCDAGVGAWCEERGTDEKQTECQYYTRCNNGYEGPNSDDKPDLTAGPNKPKCTPKKYDITYELNPESLEELNAKNDNCSPKNYTYNEETTINCAPTSDKYDFIGWYTEDDPTYAQTRTIGKNATSPITFYAKWGEKDCDKKSYPGGDAEQKCICTERKTWDAEKETCVCGEGYEWRDKKCSPLPPPSPCPLEKQTNHQSAYDAAIALIKNEYKTKAKEIIKNCKEKTPGTWYMDKTSLKCVETEKAE